jgi:hypothetical protein
MTKVYQEAGAKGLQIPDALCKRAGLEGRVVIEAQEGRIEIKPAILAVHEAKRFATRFILHHLGDALAIGAMTMVQEAERPAWRVEVRRAVTGEQRGELVIDAESGAVLQCTVQQPV